MALFKGGAFIDDPWQGREILSMPDWQERRKEGPLPSPLGIRMDPGFPVETLAADLEEFALIEIAFPKFTDGRGYSMGWLLRRRFDFQGELRAVGDVLFDELQFMVRCGFDAFEIVDAATLDLLANGRNVNAFDRFYQPGSGWKFLSGQGLGHAAPVSRGGNLGVSRLLINPRCDGPREPGNMPSIKQAKILIMATDGFEQSELFVPLEKLRAAGATVQIAAPKVGEIRGWDKTDWGKSVAADIEIDEVDADDFDALVLPGGQMNPDVLRMNDRAVEIVLDFLDSEKIVAAICHAPWLLVEADAVEGRTLTSWPSVKTDIENAGGDWVDEEVVVDDNMITSRSPKDLDAFVAKIIEELEESDSLRQSA